jgi:hypothetical protein
LPEGIVRVTTAREMNMPKLAGSWPPLSGPRLLYSLVLVSAALCASLAFGCGGGSQSNLRAHSYAAQTLDDIAVAARQTVMEVRQSSLIEAGQRAEKAGAPVTPAVLAAAEDFDAGSAIKGVNAFITAKDAYVRAVLVATRADEPDWVGLKLALQSALQSYDYLRAALGERAKLPEVPKAVMAVLTSRADDPGRQRRARDALALRSMLFVEAWI